MMTYTEVANSAAYYMEKVNINIVRVRVHLAKFVKAIVCACIHVQCTISMFKHSDCGLFWESMHRICLDLCIYQLCNYRCMFVC